MFAQRLGAPAVQGGEIWRTLTAPIQDNQLRFDDRGLSEQSFSRRPGRAAWRNQRPTPTWWAAFFECLVCIADRVLGSAVSLKLDFGRHSFCSESAVYLVPDSEQPSFTEHVSGHVEGGVALEAPPATRVLPRAENGAITGRPPNRADALAAVQVDAIIM